MANERVNRSPLSAREGKVYLDGVLIADTCKFQVVFKPDVWSGKQLSEPGTNRRWIGYDIEVTIEEWKTTRRYRNMIDSYLKDGKTPELTIQGVQTDKTLISMQRIRVRQSHVLDAYRLMISTLLIWILMVM